MPHLVINKEIYNNIFCKKKFYTLNAFYTYKKDKDKFQSYLLFFAFNV